MPPPPGGMPPPPPGGAGFPGGPAGAPPQGLPPISGISPGGDQGMPTGDPNRAVAAVTQMVMEIDRLLSMCARVFAETGGSEITQAQQLLQEATAKFVAAKGGGQTGAISPTETGESSFPGGF